MSKKDSVKAIAAQGELKAIKSAQKSKPRKRGRARPSWTGWLAYFITPLVTFLGGNFVVGSAGAANQGTMKQRFQWGINSLMLSYVGFDIKGSFKPKALLQGWAFPAINYIVRKTRINRQVPRGVPIIF